ncbi:hypothetical protein EV401DRAFT_2097058 [Pisolithus croceorrhizus]|nr:hypothetical protein EV401DRAFT_2097058 [Pisolithus croceorrhizus]
MAIGGRVNNQLVFPSNATLMVSALVLWILAEGFRAIMPGAQGCRWQFLATELVKSIYFLAAWFFEGTCDGGSFHAVMTEEQALDDFAPSPETDDSPDVETPLTADSWGLWGARSMVIVTITSVVYALRTLIDSKSRETADIVSFYLNIPLTNLCILSTLRTLLSRTFPASFWHAAVIQFSGLFILRVDHAHTLPWSLLLALALCNSTFFSLIDMLNGLHQSRTIYFINAIIFAFSFIISSVLSTFQTFPTRECFGGLTPANIFLPAVEAGRDITAMYIVHRYDAAIQGISTSLASAFLVTCIALQFYQASSAFLGCFIVAVACIIYLHNFWKASEAWREPPIQRSRIVILVLGFMLFLASGYTLVGHWTAGFSPVASSISGYLGDIGNSRQCISKQSPSHLVSYLQGDYSHFDNVLLIVFFSHARYDANLDYHKEILYIGPATREDAGFTHSYDVYVDSYQSDEDISDPWNYKMAGRMAHHMLYTALQDNECFEGYLWAPFDTLLNVPRLQQFNQSLFWYHSPWGQPIPNPAFGDLRDEATLDRSRHAPAANISPDPSLNLTESWRGWGLDWWWGDPHVGVAECMRAFRKVPSHLRENLAALTGGETRLIGGSADTMYIPGRHRKLFMEVLGLFLETNCFLEIATPTTLHLAVPPGEPIQFVDHWWIYQPPFNASFVRQKWAEGFEVDTFHTFHWGERGSDGVWKGDYHHVDDVRHLLQESADRQGIPFPALTESPP